MNNKPLYKAHYGKGCPVSDFTYVEVAYSDGTVCCGIAKAWIGWKWDPDLTKRNFIIAYRVID